MQSTGDPTQWFIAKQIDVHVTDLVSFMIWIELWVGLSYE